MTVQVRATYRIQLHPGFRFDHAIDVLDHLVDLGISHVYTSPVLESGPGSTHGYDVTDHTRVRAELGGDSGLLGFVEALRRRGMGWIVDLVPNHVSVADPRANPRWWDLLEHGPGARSAVWFDLDLVAGDGRVVLPVLGAPLEEELARGTVELRRRGAETVIGYHDYEVPTAPGTVEDADVDADGPALRRILDAQHHRLSYWREGDRNYRAFFDIDSLAAVRVEEQEVFHDIHRLLADWVAAGMVDGVRVDHVDGLADPTGYLRRLRELIGPDRGLWVEKVLVPGEELAAEWEVDGTTGYDFARLATSVGVDPRARERFDSEWRACGESRDYEAIEWDAKRAVITGPLEPETRRAVAAAHDAGVPDADSLVVELAVALGVYRTYGRGTEPLGHRDASVVERAIARAATWRPDLEASLQEAGQVLREPGDEISAEFRSRFQKLTGPAMAKGAEDTAFYRYHRLVALNEVGGDPGRFGVEPAELHVFASRTLTRHPRSLLAGSTHDTKRSADVRARLAALTQFPDRWHAALADLRRLAEPFRPSDLDAATEHLMWQTVVGAWPIDGDRLAAFLTKAAREADLHTSWIDVDDGYEQSVTGFARRVVADAGVVAALEGLVDVVAPAGRSARLAEVVLRCTSPGVPDAYRGDQDWDLSLVDPDNRRPVDHGAIARRLADAIAIADIDALGVASGSLAKLWVTHRLLTLRAEHPTWFDGGALYEPLATADSADAVVAYRRGHVVVAFDPRPGLGAREVTVSIPPGAWRDVLRRSHHVTGARDVPSSELWPGIPVGVLVPA